MAVAQTLAIFAGGLGFFLLGMRLMTDGLKVAAGGALERVLRSSTSTRIRAFGAGAAMTALVQSSSAITIAALGFVNAGLLDLGSSVWVIYGSNVGTTATGWLVALTGLDFDIEAFALPLVGVGTLVTLSGSSKRRGAIGATLTGLGLLFVGLGVLSDSFGQFATQVDLSAMPTSGVLGSIILLIVGILLTAAMQSSSAAIAITLTANASGVIDLPGAAAMVIGANLGTTSTALFATLKATPEAKRVAAAHVAFNALAGISALLLLPVLLQVVTSIQARVAGTSATVSLAIFHTAFNVLGVLIMWPLSSRLIAKLKTRFVSPSEEEAKPRYLDPSILQVPRVALRALTRETSRLGSLAGRMLSAALDGKETDKAALQDAFDRLLRAITEYVDEVDRRGRSEEVSTGLRQLLRATRHYVIVTEQAQVIHGEAFADVHEAAHEVIAAADPLGNFDVDRAGEAFGALQERYDSNREPLLAQVGQGEVSARDAMDQQLLLTEIRRAAKHFVRGARDLGPLRDMVSEDKSPQQV